MSRGWESRQQRTRAEILHAVGEIIAADGLDGLTMRKLADRAGVAVATLYNQFTDRDGVLVAFVSSGLDQLLGTRRNHRRSQARVEAGARHAAVGSEFAPNGQRR